MAVDWRIRYVLLSLIWGLSFMFITIGVETLAPLQVAHARLGLGALTLLTVMLLRRERLPAEPRMWGHMTVAGLAYNVVPFTLFSFAATLIPSALSGIVNATTPLFTLLLAALFLPSERPTATRLAGIAVGFAGVVVVMGGPDAWAGVSEGDLGPVVLGMTMGLGAAACYGVASVYTRRFLTDSGYSTASLAAGQVLTGVLLLTPVTVAFTTAPTQVPVRVVLSMLALGILGTGVTYLLFYGLVREVGATLASTVTYLLPVIAVVAGSVVLSERLQPHQLVGGVIVLVGAVLAQRSAGGTRSPDAADPGPAEADGAESADAATGPGDRQPDGGDRQPVATGRPGAPPQPAAATASSRANG